MDRRVRQELLVSLEMQVPKDRVDPKVVEDLQVWQVGGEHPEQPAQLASKVILELREGQDCVVYQEMILF